METKYKSKGIKERNIGKYNILQAIPDNVIYQAKIDYMNQDASMPSPPYD